MTTTAEQAVAYSQSAIFDTVTTMVDQEGLTRPQAFEQIAATHKRLSAGNAAAAYYREARQRSRPQPKEEHMETAEPLPPDEDPGSDPPAEDDDAAPRAGQLSFDGFPVRGHTVKIAGRSIEIADDQADEFKLGERIEYRFTLRIVKSNNHLVNENDTDLVDHDIVGVMDDITRVVVKAKKKDSE